MDQTFRVDVSVLSLARIPKRQAELAIDLVRGAGGCPPFDTGWHLEPRTITGYLTYPLSCGVKVSVHPYERRFRMYRTGRSYDKPGMNLGWVLWCLAKAYVAIYKKHAVYGVWGHDIGDLSFSTIRIAGDRFEVSLSS